MGKEEKASGTNGTSNIYTIRTFHEALVLSVVKRSFACRVLS